MKLTVADYSEKYKSLASKSFPRLQDDAMKHFSRMGFPTIKNEEWKYTNLSALINKEFQFPVLQKEVSKEEVMKQFPFIQNSICVVIENGNLNNKASSINDLPKGLAINKLSEVGDNEIVKRHYNLYVDVHDDVFGALNTAFANDGLVVHVNKNAIIERPLYLINISSSLEQAVIAHNRLLVIAEKNSSLKINWLTFSKSDSSETFLNAENEIVVDENASLEFNILQNENKKSYQICGTHTYQSANSRFSINTIALGGSILRNKLHIKLDGQNCEAHMHGLYIADESQLIDNHTAVYHSKPNSNSNQLYKGIISGKAHGVFNGKIFVERDAQKTNAYQSNKNILLSNDAVVNAKPQLEIYADDVKCTHGATTGQMDEDALFYLRSRGINENEAKAILNLAFANDILNNTSDPDFREYLSSVVETKLKNAVK